MLKTTMVDFLQWRNCIKLENDFAELIVSTELGPRIISYRAAGGENFFAVFKDQIARPDKAAWRSFGGHRLWTAPEVYPRTYYPDYDQPQAEHGRSLCLLEQFHYSGLR